MEKICVNCGNDLACEGNEVCLECLEELQHEGY